MSCHGSCGYDRAQTADLWAPAQADPNSARQALMADPAVAWLLPATAADPTTVNAYTFNKLLSGSRAGSARRAASKIVLLGQYARAMEYLVSVRPVRSGRTTSILTSVSRLAPSQQLHSFRMFATTFLNIRSRAPRHQDLKSQVLRLRTAFGSYPPHPKALLLRQMLLHHFAPRQEGDGKGDLNPETTRVMVFCSYREAIEDILVRSCSLCHAALALMIVPAACTASFSGPAGCAPAYPSAGCLHRSTDERIRPKRLEGAFVSVRIAMI